jgi:hypothetical protein
VDGHETTIGIFTFLYPDQPGGYDPRHHFDHPPGIAIAAPNTTEDQQAFTNARDYVLGQRDIVIQNLGVGKCSQTGDALDAMGRALHAIQDVYSHSNYVDLAYGPAQEGLSQNEQNTLDAAVLDPSIEPPVDLRLTLFGYAILPENPTGTCNDSDPTVYCHQYWAKDFPGKNPISTYKNNSIYIAANQAAQNATARFITNIINAVGQSTWNATVGNYGTSNSGCQQPQPPCSQEYAACNPTSFNGQVVVSGDPNDKAGSQGVGTQQYISGATPLRYAIQFGNEPTATAPARKVVVTDPLDTNNDNLPTFSLGPVTLLGQTVTPPPGAADFSTTVDLTATTGLLVNVNTHLDRSTGILTGTFQSIDPTTGNPPTNPAVGFLSPGGIGSFFFTVQPKPGLATNTQIQNQGSVVFDANAPVTTPTWLNTIDNTPPTSSVQPLPSTEPSGSFTVNWSGTDIGAGVQDYTIYVSDNGGSFTAWQQNTTATSATYTGQPGHTYGFYSIARDLVANVEAAKTNAEATTMVALLTPTVTFVGAPPSAVYNTSFTVTATTNASTTAVITASGACSIVGNTVTMTSGTGTCALTASWPADSSYMAASATQTVTAAPAPLTITASSGSMTYGGSPYVVGPVPSGFVNGDTLASLPTQPTCGPPFSSSTQAGTYLSSCTGPALDGNYAVTYATGSVIVGQASSAVSLTSSSQSSDLAGQALTFTATVTDNSSGSTGTPTGTVQLIYSGVGTIASAVPLVNGVATFIYAPVWAGTATAVYSGDNNFTGSNSNAVGQTVTAAPIASITPAETQFTGQDIHTTSQPQPVQISNIGTAALNISSISITGPASDDFSLTKNCPSSLPGLASSSATPSSCTIYVSFTPDDTGVRTATLSITDNDPLSSPQLVGLTGLAQSAINSDFNRSKIVAGNYIWFTAQLAVRGPVGRDATPDPVQIFFTNSAVTFKSNGVSYNLPAPNAVVVFSPTATTATTTYDTVNGRWVTTVPSVHPTKKCSVYTVDTRTFLTGFAFPVPAGGLPGDIEPVMWSGSFASDTPGVSLRWRWGAAVYTQFSTDYNALGVKPVEDDHEATPAWWTRDPAGTPENYKQYWTRGASGDDRDDFTGDPSRVAGASPSLAPLSLSPTELNFGSAQVGATSATSPMTVTVANNGAVPMTISSITVSGTHASDFVIQSNNCTSPLAPPPSSSTSPPPNVCTLSITFTPGDVGTRSGVLAITSGPDSNTQSTQTVDLGGNGTP